MKLNMFNKLKAFSVDDWMKRMEKGNKRVFPYLVELANEYNEKIIFLYVMKLPHKLFTYIKKNLLFEFVGFSLLFFLYGLDFSIKGFLVIFHLIYLLSVY